MAVSSDADLRSHLRKELGLTNASRIPDSRLDTEIEAGKKALSDAIAYRAETGETFDFYGEEMADALTFYMQVRLVPLSANRGGPPQDRIPGDHPVSVSHMRRADFGDSKANFWRDRMVHHFNRI